MMTWIITRDDFEAYSQAHGGRSSCACATHLVLFHLVDVPDLSSPHSTLLVGLDLEPISVVLLTNLDVLDQRRVFLRTGGGTCFFRREEATFWLEARGIDYEQGS